MIRATRIAPLALITTVLWLALPAAAQTAATPTVPVITTILKQRVALGLSPAQVEALGRLGLDFVREAIRRRADLQLLQIDLDIMLDPPAAQTVDVKASETKLREIEKIRTDLQLALIRAVETARAQLTADQRSTLSALLVGTAAPGDPDPVSDPPDATRGTRPGPSGGSKPAPSGPRPAPPGGGAHPRPPAPRRDGHDSRLHVVIRGWSTFWWEPYWFYAPPPVIVEEPPVYVPPPPTLY